MATKDCYEILGLSKGASGDEIKKAYRRLAMKWHPDRNPGDKNAEERFKEIQEAYATLSDDKKRQLYDQLGADGYKQATQGGGAGGGGFNGDFAGFEDIFGQFFGGGFGGFGGGARRAGRATSAARQAVQGDDLLTRISLTLEQAASGITTNVKFNRLATCDSCHGTGCKNGAKPTPCKTCGGSGVEIRQSGFFSMQQTCLACRGRGVIIENPCPNCRGIGLVETSKTLEIKIPAGVDQDDRIRIAGEGNAGINGGASGDLYVAVQLKPHKIFTRDGLNLHCEVPISFTTAALGGTTQVPTLNGKVDLKIPAGLQSGKVLRLAKQGISGIRGGQGDLYCTITVETPIDLNAKQREALEQFEKLLAEDHKNHSPIAKSWFDNLKDFFKR